jgi:hypothetical protein
MYKYLILLVFLLVSCNNNSEDMDVMETNIDLKLTDNSGKDLLNPIYTNSYNNNNISLIYNENDVEQIYYCDNCDPQKGYYFYERDNYYVIRLFPNYKIQSDNSDPITFIQWNETERDTIQCHIERNESGSSIVCTKVWYNGDLVWDNQGERYFTVIKNN